MAKFSLVNYSLPAFALNSCIARPGLNSPQSEQVNTTVTTSLDQVAIECTSCRDVVGFTQRLFDTSDLKELKTNLTSYCVSGGGANWQWVSHLMFTLSRKELLFY